MPELKNQGIKYSLCAVDVFAKYTKVKRCKIKAKTFLHGFIEIVN